MRAPPARVYLAPVSLGLGDLVVSLPALQALIAAGRETWLVARSEPQRLLARRIEGLAGVVREGDPFAGEYLNLRDHPLQRESWWGSEAFEEEHGALGINDILARICATFGIEADFARPRPLSARARPGLRDTVLLVAATDGPAKRWPAAHWTALADGVRARGLKARVVTDGRTSPALGIDEAPAPTPGDAVDLLSSCRAVVGVDTGLTHIAVQQGTPTVALHRRPPVFFRPFSHARAVLGAACDRACRERELSRAYHARVELAGFAPAPWECAAARGCLTAISPAQVLSALDEVLA
jgi:ADP-heptose:LPS heptosyltransferase